MTVTFEEYNSILKAFFSKHQKGSNEISVYTSPLENDRYYKTYTSTDGAQFSEVNEHITELVKAEAHGITFYVPVKFLRTEFYSTDDSKSRYVYSKI